MGVRFFLVRQPLTSTNPTPSLQVCGARSRCGLEEIGRKTLRLSSKAPAPIFKEQRRSDTLMACESARSSIPSRARAGSSERRRYSSERPAAICVAFGATRPTPRGSRRVLPGRSLKYFTGSTGIPLAMSSSPAASRCSPRKSKISRRRFAARTNMSRSKLPGRFLSRCTAILFRSARSSRIRRRGKEQEASSRRCTKRAG